MVENTDRVGRWDRCHRVLLEQLALKSDIRLSRWQVEQLAGIREIILFGDGLVPGLPLRSRPVDSWFPSILRAGRMFVETLAAAVTIAAAGTDITVYIGHRSKWGDETWAEMLREMLALVKDHEEFGWDGD